MQVIVKVRGIQEQHQGDNTVRLYLEFEFTKPAAIDRVNVTKQNAHFLNICREMEGKECILSLSRDTFNGRAFWRLEDTTIELVKTTPVLQNKAA